MPGFDDLVGKDLTEWKLVEVTVIYFRTSTRKRVSEVIFESGKKGAKRAEEIIKKAKARNDDIEYFYGTDFALKRGRSYLVLYTKSFHQDT